MKKTLSISLAGFAFAVTGSASGQDLLISGVYDGPLVGGDPKGIELYAVNAIPDLSLYGLGTANNGEGSDGVESTLPPVSLAAGEFYYVANTDDGDFTQWFGFAPDHLGGVNHNGDDAHRTLLRCHGNFTGDESVIDVFGDINTDGTGTAWDSVDGWAYRKSGVLANNGTFTASDWYFSGPDEWDGDDNDQGTDDGTNATATPSFPIATYSTTAPATFTLAIGHNNDGESALLPDGTEQGPARFVTLVNETRAAYSNFLMLSSGDNFLAGTARAAADDNDVDYDAIVLDAIGYDALALGNHDFDFGEQYLADFINATNSASPEGTSSSFPFLGANLDFSSAVQDLQDLETAGRIAASTTIDVNGRNVGIIGAVTPTLSTISSPENVSVADRADTIDAINDEIATLKGNGVDIIILISHFQGLSDTGGNGELDIIDELDPGIDVVIAGGGDELLDDNDDANRLSGEVGDTPFGPYPLVAQDSAANDVYVVTTPGEYKYLGLLELEFDAYGDVASVGSNSGLIPNRADSITGAPDTDIETKVETPVAGYETSLANIEVAETEVPYDTSRSNIRESMGNWGAIAADAYRTQGEAEGPGLGVTADYYVGMQNGGGIRGNAEQTDDTISYLDVINEHPFGNTIVILKGATPAQILDILESGVRGIPGQNGAFLQISGLTFTYDVSKQAAVYDSEGVLVTPGERVQDVFLADGTQIISNGSVVPANSGLNIAIVTNNFSAAGGDSIPFDVVDPSPTLLQDRLTPQEAAANSEPLNRSAATGYAQTVLEYLVDLGTVTEEQYAESAIENRIVQFDGTTEDADKDNDGINDALEQILIDYYGNDRIEDLSDVDETTDFDGDGILDSVELLNGEFALGACFDHGGFDTAAAEIVSFDPTTDQLFVSNVEDGTVDVLDASNPSALTLITQVSLAGTPNHVEVKNGVVAVAVANTVKTDDGFVSFFDSSTFAHLGDITAGANPDMLTFSADGTMLAVANEGEPNDDYSIDPEGTVTIIEFGAAVSTANAASGTASHVGFSSFNADEATLKASGVRIFGPGATVAQDLEPEYLAFGANGNLYVTLQENNAFGIIDLTTKTATSIVPLGFKDWSTGPMLDASNRDLDGDDGTINLQNWPVFGMYQPDGMQAFEVGGQTYLITANEGDARDYDTFSEEERVGDLSLDAAIFTDPSLQDDENLGRLNITTTLGDLGNDGDYEELYAYGARSFSIWDANGALVWDSGDEFEQYLAANYADIFNSNNDDNDSFDSRSDDKGPEPEVVEVGTIDGTLYAFIGLERIGGIMIYDISVPTAPVFVDYFNDRDFSQHETNLAAGALGPEGIDFIPAADSPTGANLLAVANEVSGTTCVYDLDSLLSPSTTLTITDCGFDGSNFFIEVEGGTVGRKVTSSDDLQAEFTDVPGVTTDGNRFLIPADSRDALKDFFRVEEQ